MSGRILAFIYAIVLDNLRKILPRSFIESDTVSKRTVHFRLYVLVVETYLWFLRSIERRGFDFLAMLQEERLRRMMKKAWKSKWWRSYLQSYGISPGDIRNPSDLSRIPIVTRKILANVSREDLATCPLSPPSIEWGISSGSTTGVPIKIAFQKSFLRVDQLARVFRQFEWHGLSFLKESNRNFFVYLKNDTYRGKDYFKFVNGGWFLSSRDREPGEQVRDIIRAMSEIDGPVLNTTPDDLFFFVDVMKRFKLDPPKVLFCRVASNPLDKRTRRIAERYLKCPVRDAYGAQELGALGSECEDRLGFMHIFSERVAVEIVDEKGEGVPYGKTGRVIVTCLDNALMPLLRYEVGDWGALFVEACRCGNPSPLLKLESRTSDFIEMADSVRKSIRPLFKFLSWEPFFSKTRRAQVRQERSDLLVILLEAEKALPQRDIMKLKEKIRKTYGSFVIDVKLVRSIPATGAKFNHFVPLEKLKLREPVNVA